MQSRSFNWGTGHVLKLHIAGEFIPSRRSGSKALTRICSAGGDHLKGGLLLQGGGFWQGVNAVRKWSRRRRGLMWKFANAVESVEGTAEHLVQAKALGMDDAVERPVANSIGFAALSSDLVACSECHPDLSYNPPAKP